MALEGALVAPARIGLVLPLRPQHEHVQLMVDESNPGPEKVSAALERWLASKDDKTLGGLIDLFEDKSFAIVFVLLLGVPALPLPTGGGDSRVRDHR